MTWSVMRSRVHGSYLGPLSGIRYLETIYRDNRKPQPSAVPSGDHWIVIPAGLNSPPIPPNRKEVVTLASPGRKLHLYRYESALDPGRIVGEKGPCPWIFPTMWSEQNTEVLQLVGFADGHGPDVHSCFKDGKQGTLVVALGKNAGHLTVQISDDGHFSNRPDSPISATLHTPGFPPLKLAPTLDMAYAEKRWMAFSFPSHDEARTLHLTIKPRGNLAFIDVF